MRREPKCNNPEISAEGADLSARHVDLRVRRRSGRVRQAGPAARAASNRGLQRHDRATSRGARSHDFYPIFSLPAPGWPRFEAPGGRIRASISQTSRAFASMHSPYVDDTSPPPLAEPRLQSTLGRDAAGDVPAILDFLPPVAYPHVPATSFATKFVHVSTGRSERRSGW